MRKLISVFLLSVLVVDSQAVEVIADNNLETPLMEFRLRSFNNTGAEEVYIGVPSVGDAANREAVNHSWSQNNWLELSYSHATDLMQVNIFSGPRDDVNGTIITTLSYPNWEVEMQSIIGSEFSVHDLNALHIVIYNRETDGELSFEQAELNGESLGGGFNLPPGSVIPSVDGWTLQGVCFADFNLYGNVVRSGSFSNSQERGKIEFRVGTEATDDAKGVLFNNGFEFCR